MTYADLQTKIAVTAEQATLRASIAPRLPEGISFAFNFKGTIWGELSVDQTRDALKAYRTVDGRDLTDADIALAVSDRDEVARRIAVAERIDAVLPEGYTLRLTPWGETNRQATLSVSTGESVDIVSLDALALELRA